MSRALHHSTAANGEPVHLVWFHHAGGHGESFRAMAAHLPPHWSVSLLAYPGRGPLSDLRPRDNLGELASWLTPQVAQLVQRSDGRIAFFGHSMGALVAHEMAWRLQDLHLPTPFWLGVSGHRAPEMVRPQSEWLHPLPDAELVEQLRLMGALPPHAITPQYLQLMRADLRACETRPAHHRLSSGRLPAALSTFTGDADPMVHPDAMRPWACRVTGDVRHHVLPGGHFFLAGIQRRRVLELIVQDVERALRTGNDSFFAIHDHATRTRTSHHASFGL